MLPLNNGDTKHKVCMGSLMESSAKTHSMSLYECQTLTMWTMAGGHRSGHTQVKGPILFVQYNIMWSYLILLLLYMVYTFTVYMVVSAPKWSTHTALNFVYAISACACYYVMWHCKTCLSTLLYIVQYTAIAGIDTMGLPCFQPYGILPYGMQLDLGVLGLCYHMVCSPIQIDTARFGSDGSLTVCNHMHIVCCPIQTQLELGVMGLWLFATICL